VRPKNRSRNRVRRGEEKVSPSGIVRVGCAGWSLPKEHTDRFPADGTHLERYAGRFPAVEIDSSFYKPHRPTTYVRWAASVPADFRFSVKVPKVATHERRLVDPEDVLDSFLAEATQLGDGWGHCLSSFRRACRSQPKSRSDSSLRSPYE
jgi:uncharacterized protein YecE (DUF72 family)